MTDFNSWNWPKFQQVAKKYVTRGKLAKGNRAAYEAGRRNGWLDRHYGEHTKRKSLIEHYGIEYPQ